MPPAAAITGSAARLQVWRAPPGAVASTTSFVASAKKNAMPTSLTGKASAAATRAYEAWARFAQTRAITAPAGRKREYVTAAASRRAVSDPRCYIVRAARRARPDASAIRPSSAIVGRGLAVRGSSLRPRAAEALAVPDVPTALGSAVAVRAGAADAVLVVDGCAAVDGRAAVSGCAVEAVVVAAAEAVVVDAVAAGRCELDSFSSASVETGLPFSSIRDTSAPVYDATRSASVVVDVDSSFIASTG